MRLQDYQQNFAVKMNKRYEDLVNHFVPRPSSKQLMRKTLINTKFQWLMKYLNNDPPSIQVQPSQLIKARTTHDKYAPSGKTFFIHNAQNNSSKWRQKCKNTSFYPTQSVTLKTHIRSRMNTEPVQSSIFMEKEKMKTNSLLMHRSCSRRRPIFFEKQNGGRMRQKIKTMPNSIGRGLKRKCPQKQAFVLTPWILPEDNTENNDITTFF